MKHTRLDEGRLNSKTAHIHDSENLEGCYIRGSADGGIEDFESVRDCADPFFDCRSTRWN